MIKGRGRIHIKIRGKTLRTIYEMTKSEKKNFKLQLKSSLKHRLKSTLKKDLKRMIKETLKNAAREISLIYNGSLEPPGYNIEPYHNIGACYWIMPVKIKDISKISWHTKNQDSLAEEEISIDQKVFESLLYPIFKRHFDNDLPENKARGEEYSPTKYNGGIAFDRDLSDNFYSFEQMEEVLADVKQLIATDKEKLTPEELGFYEDFDRIIRKMMKAGTEKGYKILSVGSL